MYQAGFLKVVAATPRLEVGDIKFNQEHILHILNDTKAGVVVFPELGLTGYSASDLFYQQEFIKRAELGLKYILEHHDFKGLFVLGMPLDIKGVLYNVAVVIQERNILGIVPKHYLPNNQEFYEKRWFQSGRNLNVFEVELLGQVVPFGNLIFEEKEKDIRVGVEICQDLWAIDTPADDLSMAGANLILNLSASTEYIGKEKARRHAVLDHSRKQAGAYVYTSTGHFESVSETLFSNHKLIASRGVLLKESSIFSKNEEVIEADINMKEINFQRRQDSSYRDMHFTQKTSFKVIPFSLEETKVFEFSQTPERLPFVLSKEDIQTAQQIQMHALARKVLSLPKSARNIVVGISGGLDSTLALLVAQHAIETYNLDAKIIAVTMPADATSKKTKTNAIKLMEYFNLEYQEIPIQKAVDMHLKDISHQEQDVTFENAQARFRTLILMDLANKYQGFVLGTGDLSEIALGFMTYNGDQMSMYAINSGIPKTLVSAMVTYYAEIYPDIQEVLFDIVKTPISPELTKKQVTEQQIGRYDINDFILYHHLQSGLDETDLSWFVGQTFHVTDEEATRYVERFFKRFYTQQFKRQTLPEGPKIVSISLSPRGTFRMPSDVKRK